MLQKHPLVATATAVAAACHSPPPQPRSLRGFIVVVFIVIISPSALPSPPSSPPSSVIYLIVMPSCPLPSIVVHSSPFFTQHFITISPLVPPLFVDCCFKRRTKPLLPTMVLSLSSWPSALVGCFRCPPPPTLAASHGSRRQQSVAFTNSASMSPLPCPPLVVATPPAVPNSAESS